MRLTIIYICQSCYDQNEINRNKPGYELKVEETEALNEAVDHCNQGHTVYSEIRSLDKE